MKKKALLTTEIDAGLKSDIEKILAENHISPSDLVSAFFEKVKKQPSILKEFLCIRSSKSREPADIMATLEAERNDAEKVLEDIRERYRNLFHSSIDMIFVLNSEGKIFDANNKALESFGYTKEEISALHVLDLHPKETHSKSLEMLEKIRKNGSVRFEAEFVKKNGDIIIGEVSGSLSKSASGNIIHGIIKDISESKRIEIELRDSEEQFRNLAEQSPNMIFINQNGRVVFANKKCEEIMGYTRDEICSPDFNYLSLISPKDHTHIRENFQRHSNGEEVKPWVHTIVTKTGYEFEAIITTRLINFKNARAILGIVTDISTQKNIETDLRRSEEKLRSIFASSPSSIIVTDMNGIITECNDATIKMFEYSREEFIGKDGFTLPAKFEISRARTNIKRVLDQVTVLNAEYIFATKTRHEFPAEISVSLIRDQIGASIGFVAVINDITKRKLGEETLRESERRFRDMLENVQLISVILDTKGNIIFCNDFLLELSQWKIEEVLGNNWFDMFLPEDNHTKVHSYLQKLSLLENIMPHHENEILTKNGKRRIISWNNTVLKDPEGRVIGTASIGEDVTARRKSEEERLKIEEKIRQTQKLESLGILARGIAHDFNNLLTTVLGFANLASLKLEDGSQIRDFIKQIEIAAKQGAGLTNQLLAYAGKGRFDIQMINLGELIQEMGNLLEVSMSKKCRLEYYFAPDLQSIEGDITQIRQIIMNLIINAAEAIGDKNGTIYIRTGCTNCDRKCLTGNYLGEELPEGFYSFIEVADTGSGMTPEVQSRIFDPFYSTKFAGRGLGLAAVLGIVRRHKGMIKVNSELGKGATFRVYLPVCRRNPESAEIMTETNYPSIKKGTVLMIDDEETIRIVSKMIIEDEGYGVITAKDGREGLDIFIARQKEIHIIILDLTMPLMDGAETFAELRKISSDVPIILSSGFNEPNRNGMFKDKGLSGFIQKPYSAKVLMDTIHKVLESA